MELGGALEVVNKFFLEHVRLVNIQLPENRDLARYCFIKGGVQSGICYLQLDHPLLSLEKFCPQVRHLVLHPRLLFCSQI